MTDNLPGDELMQAIFDASEDLTTELDQANGCLGAVIMMIDQSAAQLPDRGAALLAVIAASQMFLDRARTEAQRITKNSMG